MSGARAFVAEFLSTFALCFVGAGAICTDALTGGAVGLPGINILQDPIQYQSYSWHTNLDTYERIVEDDVKKSAIAIAAAVYHLAMRDELLPRFTSEEMPRRPQQQQQQPQPQQQAPQTPPVQTGAANP